MIKAFENFANKVVEWTPENPDQKIFHKLQSMEKKWLKNYSDLGLIKKMLRIDNNLHLWLDDGRVYTLELKERRDNTHEFTNRYVWDEEIGLEAKYKAIKKNSVAIIADEFDHAMSTSIYIKLIEELQMQDVTTEKQKKNGTFEFQSLRTYRPVMFSGDKEPYVVYNVYARGDATVKQGHMANNINKERINVKSWKDYISLFTDVYNHEKSALIKKGLISENMDEEEFKRDMEDSDDFIPNDILKNFSREDQLSYAIETHPDHDFWVFVGRPGYKDVTVNGKKYKEEILEIETLCRIDTVSDSQQAGMMKIRAVSQGEGSRVYGVWLPKGVFDDKYVYGSDIPDFMLPLIDQHKQIAA